MLRAKVSNQPPTCVLWLRVSRRMLWLRRASSSQVRAELVPASAEKGLCCTSFPHPTCSRMSLKLCYRHT